MDILAAGGADAGLPELVLDIGLALVAAGVLAILFTRIKIPTVAAFLLAGVILGPIGTGLIDDRANIDTIAQLGLILLLFLIGLEIDVRSLLASGRTVIVSGVLQYPLTAVFGFLVAQGAILVGLTFGVLQGEYAALYIGLAVAASSTLLVVALFQQSFTLDTQTGRMALAMLVFQDIWAIIVLALQPNLENPQVLPIVSALGGILLVTGVSLGVAQTVLPIGFRWIAKQPATILVASLAWCFAVVIAGINLDTVVESVTGLDTQFNVSAGMGALIAGATIASLPFSTEIVRQVSVVRDFFVTLFFVGLGMTIPAPDGVGVIAVAVLLAVLAIAARLVVMLPLLYATGLDRRIATLTSTKLAQISEFSLVIAFLGLQLGHIDATLNSAIILAFVITAVLTPMLFAKADPIHDWLAPWLSRVGIKAPDQATREDVEEYDLALLGVHRTASSLLHELGETDAELLSRTLVVDFNVAIHPQIAELGPHVTYGDLTSPDTLHHAGVDKARVVLCTIPDEVLASASTLDVVHVVREVNPEATLIATATTFPERDALYAAGADYVLVPRLEAAQAARDAVAAALNGQLDDLVNRSTEATARREVLD
jgi:Kef-type K+ transport system membrane component KefB/voltage-gated potassium channel Kch